jgi:hypothetical protein
VYQQKHIQQKQSLRTTYTAPSQALWVQPKLTINAPNDIYEQEAERVADQVMRMPAPSAALQRAPVSIQRCAKCAAATRIEDMCPSCAAKARAEAYVQRSATGIVPDVTPQVETRINALRGGGQPLDTSVRAFMEPRFGHDFSQVHVHTDGQAADLSRSVSALAFTVGQDVVFGAGQYQPGSDAGKRLIAHELTHVVQQNRAQLSKRLITRYTTNTSVVQRFAHRNTCRQEDLEELIWPGDYLARQITQGAIQALRIRPLSALTRKMLVKFFGNPNQSQITQIRRNFDKIHSEFQASTYTYDCRYNCESDGDNKTVGMTQVSWLFGGSGPIVLCINNLKPMMTMHNIQLPTAKTIIHEFAHRYLNFTGDHYCDPVEGCADMDADDALENADSYGDFAGDLFFEKYVRDYTNRRKGELSNTH